MYRYLYIDVNITLYIRILCLCIHICVHKDMYIYLCIFIYICISRIYSQDQNDSIFVDTPVWQLAVRDYDPLCTLRNSKSITPMVYEQVGTLFRDRFSVKPGWALYFSRCLEVGILNK